MEQDEKKLIEIIERMPDNLTDLQKVRYIYIEVCRFFSYNPEYITGDKEKKEELFDQDVDIHAMMENKAICSSLSRAIIHLLRELGIECNGVFFNGNRDGHLEVIVGVDGEIYELNPASDLMNVKMGFHTIGFARRMVQSSMESFLGYSYLTQNQIKELDDALGYTFGLSEEYIDEVAKRGESVEDHNFRIYMEEAVDEIANSLYSEEELNSYITSIHPDVDVSLLSSQDFDKYRIEFLMNYVNNFARKNSYIDRRDFFEHLVYNSMDIDDGELQLFSGTDTEGDLYTIAKFKGEISEEDLFYLIRENQDIRQLSMDKVRQLLDGGFKTIAKGREKDILSKDGPFRATTYDFSKEINLYIVEAETEEEMNEREAEVYAVIMLQRVRQGIAYYKEAVYNSQNNPDSITQMKMIYDEFVKFVRKHEYEKDFPAEDISDQTVGIQHLLDNLQKLEEQLMEEAEPVLKIIEDYKQALKDEAFANNYMLYHVSIKSPEEMEGGELRPHFEKTQFHQYFGEILCGSTESVESNPYILARVNGNKGMQRLSVGRNSYLLNGHDVSVEQDEKGNKRAVAKNPGYIYYMPIDEFEPVIQLKYNQDKNEYHFEFEEEWVTDHPIRIPREVTEHIGAKGEIKEYPEDIDEPEVFAIEKYDDVTSILEHNQILINNDLGKRPIDLLVKNVQTNMHVSQRIIDYIRDKKVTYLNAEVGVNVYKGIVNMSKLPVINYQAEAILHGQSVVTTEEVRPQRARIRAFVENAIRSKSVTYGDYMEIMRMRLPEEKDDKKQEQ